MMQPGVLYLVPVPIGHPDDITFRALDTLRSVDYVIAEERKPAMIFLRREGIEKPLLLLNEHTESAQVPHVIQLLQSGKSCALISDGGTPVFEDPGAFLMQKIVAKNLLVVPLPGPSALVPALVMSGLPIAHFVYGGLLPRDPDARRTALSFYKEEAQTVVFFDAPYRLGAVLDAAADVLGDRVAAVIFDLSLPTEEVWRGTLSRLAQKYATMRQKRLFVLVIGGKRPLQNMVSTAL